LHELHLAQDVYKVIKREAEKEGLSRVTSAKIRIGQSLIHDPQEFKEIFLEITRGSLAEGMQLEVEVVPLKAFCASCKKEYDAKIPRLDCPHCGSTNIQLSAGKELLIEDLK